MKFGLKRVLITTLVAGILVSPAIAEVLTLDDCIELALKNRASIVSAIGSEKVAAAGKRSALGAFLPRLSADYTYAKSRTTDIKAEQSVRSLLGMDSILIQGRYSDSLSSDTFVFEQPVYGPASIREFSFPDIDGTNKSLSIRGQMSLIDFSNWFNYSVARANHAVARLNVLASEQDLIYAVKVAYFAYLAANENVDVQREAVKRAEEQLKLIQSRYDLGSASKSDVLKQKVQYGNDKLALLTAVNAISNSKSTLAYVIGIDPAKDWEFSTTFTSRQFSGSLEEAIAFGLEHKPGLLASAQRVNAARGSVRAARMGYLPTVGGFASLTFNDGTRGDTVAFNQSSTSRSIGFNVTYNIFDGFVREDRVTQAKVALNNRRAELSDARNKMVSDVRNAYSDIEQLREQKTVSEENVKAAEEDLKITQEKYNLGAATILDLLDAQVSLKSAQVSLIRVEFDLNLAVAKLENATGKM